MIARREHASLPERTEFSNRLLHLPCESQTWRTSSWLAANVATLCRVCAPGEPEWTTDGVYDVVERDDAIHIVMEYCPKELFDYIVAQK
eukprot:1511515-Amphidinium_carterae.1